MHKIHIFFQTKTLQTHSNLFNLKTLNFIWIFHFCIMSFSLIYLFVAGFNQMVLIFHLDMYFVCSINVCLFNFPLIFLVFKPLERFLIWYASFSDLRLIYLFLRSESDFGRSMESLLGSLLKYNALEDFQEVFQTTSKKSSRRLQRNLPDDFQEVFWRVFFHIEWSLSLSF